MQVGVEVRRVLSRADHATSTVFTPVEQEPGLSVVKTWTTNDTVDGDDEVETAGQVVDYTIVVHNTGNTTLHGVTVHDSLTGNDLSVGDLAGGGYSTVTDSYAGAQRDIGDNTDNLNTATA